MKKEFTKKDLLDWMVAEYRNGHRCVLIGDRLVNSTGYDSMDSFEDNLTDKSFKDKKFDVIKVYKINTKNIHRLNDIFDITNLELIWERTEAKRMTAEEMQQNLEELTDI